MFTQDLCGKAEEAMNFYCSIFDESKLGEPFRYQNQVPDKDGTVAHSFFTLAGQLFGAMDSARGHTFKFNEAISFMVNYKDQGEINYFWDKLSADPKAEMCGWIKDKFGVSWQLVTSDMGKFMTGKNAENAMAAVMKMKRMDIDELKRIAAK